MATLSSTSNDMSISTSKLRDVRVSESDLPPSPPSTDDLHTNLATALLPQLSAGASLNLTSDISFKHNTARWSDTTFTSPTAVVNVASESDICAVVGPPSLHSLPYHHSSSNLILSPTR
jgi:hypothetical protein